MKKIILFLSFLLISVGVFGATKTEGFETKTAGNNYQGTVTISQAESDCSVGWTIYYGCVSTSSKINGNNSAALRLYTSNNYGYIKTTTAIDNLTNVSFKAKAATSNGALIKIDIKYSTNGSTWTNIETNKSLSTSATTYNVNIPSGGKYFQIAISSSSTKPSKSNAQLTIDDVVFTYTGSSPTTYTVTYNANGGTGTMNDANSPYNSGATVTVLDNSFIAPSGKQFDHWNTSSTDNGTSYNPGATFNISANTTLYAQWVDIPPSPIVSGKVFELVTDISQLNDNDNIIILDIDKEHALSTTQNTNNRGASTDFRLIMNKTVVVLNDPSTVQVLRITANSTNWELYTGSGYLFANGNSTNNYLKTQITNNSNGYWAITIDNNTYEASIIAQGSNTNTVMQYNSGSFLFACYESASQTGLYIFKESSFSDEYTITFINQLGPNSSKTQTNLGEVITLPSSINICNLCYNGNWNLAGWVTSLDVMSPIYTNDYIPTQDITLYALYGRGTEPVEVEEYKKVTSALDDWSGDYLIAYSPTRFADARTSSTNNCFYPLDPAENLIGDTVVNAAWGDLYNITLEEISEGSGTYLMKTKDDLYNYAVGSNNYINRGNEAESHPITITFNSESNILIKSEGKELQYNTGSNFFRFYAHTQQPVYLYKKQRVTKYASTEYSTAPECDYQYITNWNTGSITVPAENLEDVTNPAYVTIKNIEQGTTLVNRTGLSVSNGEYNISVANLTNNSCDKMNILVEGTDSMYMIYKVPIIVSSDINTQNSIFTSETNCAECDVVVLANKTLTTSGTTSENRDVKLYEGARLVVPSGKDYTVNTLSLRRTNDTPSYLSLKGDLVIEKDSGLYFDLYTDPEDWRWIALPETFDIRKLSLSNGKPVTFGEDYYIKYYDGQQRAEQQCCGWKAVATDKVFGVGEGFIFGIAGDGKVKKEYRFKFSNDALTREKDVAGKTISGLKAYGCSNTELRPNHKGWNIIGNVFMDKIETEIYSPIRIGHLIKEIVNGNWTGHWELSDETDAKLRYMVVKSDAPEDASAGGYKSVLLDGEELEPFEAFFIQVGGDEEANQTITISPTKRRSVKSKFMQQELDDEVFLRIFIDDKKTGFFISNKFTEDYEPGDDLESRYSHYQYINGYKLLYSAVPDSTLENGVLIHSTGGEITLDSKVNRDLFEEIWVKFNDTWYDLLNNDLIIVTEGDFRLFARLKSTAHGDVATDLENVVTNENLHIYDMMGRYLGTTDNPIHTTLTNGVYILKNNNSVVKIAR